MSEQMAQKGYLVSPNGNHYLRVLGSVAVFEGGQEELQTQVEMFERIGPYWSSVRTNLMQEDLNSYKHIDENRLPWNNEELFWSQTPWSRFSSTQLWSLASY